MLPSLYCFAPLARCCTTDSVYAARRARGYACESRKLSLSHIPNGNRFDNVNRVPKTTPAVTREVIIYIPTTVELLIDRTSKVYNNLDFKKENFVLLQFTFLPFRYLSPPFLLPSSSSSTDLDLSLELISSSESSSLRDTSLPLLALPQVFLRLDDLNFLDLGNSNDLLFSLLIFIEDEKGSLVDLDEERASKLFDNPGNDTTSDETLEGEGSSDSCGSFELDREDIVEESSRGDEDNDEGEEGD